MSAAAAAPKLIASDAETASSSSRGDSSALPAFPKSPADGDGDSRSVAPEEPRSPPMDPDLVVTNSNSAMHGAIPVLPMGWAVLCFIFNVFAPGSGTILSGFFCLCCGRTRYSVKDDFDNKLGALFMNIFIGIAQFCTIVLCFVGWCWSIGWGVTMISVSKRNKEYLKKKAREDPSNPGGTA